MNLLPKTEKEFLKKGLKLRFVVVALILISGSFLFGFVMLLPSYFLTPGHLFKDMPESYLPMTAASSDSMQLTLNLPSEIDFKLRIFQTITNSSSAVNIVSKIIKYLPKNVALDSLTFSRDQNYKEKNGTMVIISGTALSRDSLVSFSNLLKESAEFSLVEMPVSSLTKNKNLPFSMNIFIENE